MKNVKNSELLTVVYTMEDLEEIDDFLKMKNECASCKYLTENGDGYPYCDFFDDWIKDCHVCPKW